MIDCNIAGIWIQNVDFYESSTWQINLSIGDLMLSPKEFWIVVIAYIISIWCMEFIVIMALVRLL